MSDDKLKLPTEIIPAPGENGKRAVSDEIREQLLKNERAGIDASAKVDVAKLQVAKEAIVATRAFFEVLKSYNELQSTRTEWEGRVDVAATAVQKAEVELQQTQEQNKSRMEELKQSGEAMERLLSLFDDVMKEVTDADLSDDLKKESRQFLLQLSDRIVQLKK